MYIKAHFQKMSDLTKTLFAFKNEFKINDPCWVTENHMVPNFKKLAFLFCHKDNKNVMDINR